MHAPKMVQNTAPPSNLTVKYFKADNTHLKLNEMTGEYRIMCKCLMMGWRGGVLLTAMYRSNQSRLPGPPPSPFPQGHSLSHRSAKHKRHVLCSLGSNPNGCFYDTAYRKHPCRNLEILCVLSKWCISDDGVKVYFSWLICRANKVPVTGSWVDLHI